MRPTVSTTCIEEQEDSPREAPPSRTASQRDLAGEEQAGSSSAGSGELPDEACGSWHKFKETKWKVLYPYILFLSLLGQLRNTSSSLSNLHMTICTVDAQHLAGKSATSCLLLMCARSPNMHHVGCQGNLCQTSDAVLSGAAIDARLAAAQSQAAGSI